VGIPLTTGKTVTAWKDEHAKPTTALIGRHSLVIDDDIIFFIYLDATSFGRVRHFGESLCPAGPTPQSGRVKIRAIVSEFLIASQRQWCLSNYHSDKDMERLLQRIFLCKTLSFPKPDQPHRMYFFECIGNCLRNYSLV